MKNVEKNALFVRKSRRVVYAIAGAVLACSMFLGTDMTAEAVKLADVFDTKAYADSYPDLFAAFGYNAAALIKHYKEHGISEKREVDGILDVVRYREAYPDLEAAFGDNWDAYVNHYFVFGAKEGRENFTDFDGLAYAERYPDLKEAFGNDLLALYRHYQAFGKDEGRSAETYDEPEEEVEKEPEEEESLADEYGEKSNFTVQVIPNGLDVDAQYLTVRVRDNRSATITISGLSLQNDYLTNLSTSKQDVSEYNWGIDMYGNQEAYYVSTSSWAVNPGSETTKGLEEMQHSIWIGYDDGSRRKIGDAEMSHTSESISWTFTIPEDYSFDFAKVNRYRVSIYDVSQNLSLSRWYRLTE